MCEDGTCLEINRGVLYRGTCVAQESLDGKRDKIVILLHSM